MVGFNDVDTIEIGFIIDLDDVLQMLLQVNKVTADDNIVKASLLIFSLSISMLLFSSYLLIRHYFIPFGNDDLEDDDE